MGETGMSPIFAILGGAILIAAGILSSPALASWIRIILGVGGVAAIMLGMVMLFGLAYGKPKKP